MNEPGLRRLIGIAVILAAVIVPGICLADGLIVVEDPPRVPEGHFSFAPLQVSFHHVTVSVTDLAAVTTVDEEFYNPNRERLEGTYIFPLPEGASIDRFSMDIGGKMMDAELLPAGEGPGLVRGHRAEDERPCAAGVCRPGSVQAARVSH